MCRALCRGLLAWKHGKNQDIKAESKAYISKGKTNLHTKDGQKNGKAVFQVRSNGLL